MELDELRQRLLLRSKAGEMATGMSSMTSAAPIPEISLGNSTNKAVKWEPIPAEKPVPAAASKTVASEKPKAAGEPTKLELVASAIDTNGAVVGEPKKNPEPERPMNVVSINGKNGAAGHGAEPNSIAAEAVREMEPAESFREHFAQLSSLLQSIDTATESTEQALKRIARLFDHLSGLAATFQSVKAFAEQVKTLSSTFQPMKPLNDQMTQLIETFYLNVKELGTALEPVKTFQVKVRQLATSLDSINDLEERLGHLAEAFRPTKERFISQQELRG